MKKRNKKRITSINGIIAILFIAPIVVLAAIYISSERKNRFEPGNVDIQVKEGQDTSDRLEKDDYKWEPKNSPVTSYIAEKPMQIKDSRKYPGEKLRVKFVPMWYDSQGNVCSVFDFQTSNHTNGTNTLVYSDGAEKTITFNLASDWQTNGWMYSPSDDCFYYSGTLNASKLTAQLLSSVEISPTVYDELTETYTFRLDVLADAIQSSGNAAETRQWQTTTAITITTTVGP